MSNISELRTLIQVVNFLKQDVCLDFEGIQSKDHWIIGIKRDENAVGMKRIIVSENRYNLLYDLIKKNLLTLDVYCKKCHELHKIKVDLTRYARWKNGEGFIQDLLYDLTPSKRELLISGLCSNCFHQIIRRSEK